MSMSMIQFSGLFWANFTLKRNFYSLRQFGVTPKPVLHRSNPTAYYSNATFVMGLRGLKTTF